MVGSKKQGKEEMLVSNLKDPVHPRHIHNEFHWKEKSHKFDHHHHDQPPHLLRCAAAKWRAPPCRFQK